MKSLEEASMNTNMKEANPKWPHTVRFQLYDLLEKANSGELKRLVVIRGQEKEG